MTCVFLLLDADTPSEGGWSPEPGVQWNDPDSVKTGRVLVVDDEGIVRTWMARLLRKDGYSVQEAANGAEALDLAVADSIGFDLVITDIRMPLLNGWDLGRRIKDRWPNLPILYISGYDVQQPGTHGGTLLRKPFEPEDLLRVVGQLLRDHGPDA